MLETPKADSYYLCKNGADVTMDNQQGITNTENAWLSGIFDGEGCVGMNLVKNYSALHGKNTKREMIVVPRLIFSNTDYPTITRFCDLMKKAGVGVHINTQKRHVERHSACWKVTINGHKRCSRAIPLLLKYSVTKKRALELVAEWLEHREKNYHYTVKDYDMYVQFRKMYSRNALNDLTLRRFYESCTAPIYSYDIRNRASQKGEGFKA